jgi:diguanylate cyclase (GGDEF)-like protein/PAS domain S-box-containing protein
MWARVNIQPMTTQDGSVTGAIASFSDITAARQAAADLRRKEQFLQVLLDTLEEGIVACDAEGRITVFNPAARRLHGLSEESDPIGRIPTDQGLRRADGSTMEPRENPLIRAMSGEQLRDVEIILESEAGDRRKVSVNGQALVDGGWMLGAVVAMHDVTEQKLNEERLAELALHDPLTGLANRTLLAERLQQAIDGLARSAEAAVAGDRQGSGDGQRGVAVFLLDLDEFKEINDVLGHDVGDDMLIAVARRLSALVRPSDTVARLGGDEFVVVCDIESGEEEMLRINERISTALARPYRIDGRTLTAPASVGGVFVDNPDTDPSRLLSRADDAMYGVKWSRRRERRSTAD